MHFCGHGDLIADRLCGIRDHMSAVHSVGVLARDCGNTGPDGVYSLYPYDVLMRTTHA